MVRKLRNPTFREVLEQKLKRKGRIVAVFDKPKPLIKRKIQLIPKTRRKKKRNFKRKLKKLDRFLTGRSAFFD